MYYFKGFRVKLIIIKTWNSTQNIPGWLEVYFNTNRTGGVIVNTLALSEIDRGFERLSGQTKHYKIGI